MLRVLLTPRWVGWTLLAVLAVVVCGGMAYWQLVRAESPTGSLLNAGYALQWPLFGIFFAALWWRMLRLESRALDAVRSAHPLDDTGRDTGRVAPLVSAGEASPFTPRPAGVRSGAADAPPVPGSGRAEYNAMLAELARRDAQADADDRAADVAGDAGAEAAPPTPRQERS